MPRGGFRENAGRKAGWNNPETQTIRVPKVLASQLLGIARKLDDKRDLEFDTESKNPLTISKNELEEIGQVIMGDAAVTRNGKDRSSVERTITAIINLLFPD